MKWKKRRKETGMHKLPAPSGQKSSDKCLMDETLSFLTHVSGVLIRPNLENLTDKRDYEPETRVKLTLMDVRYCNLGIDKSLSFEERRKDSVLEPDGCGSRPDSTSDPPYTQNVLPLAWKFGEWCVSCIILITVRNEAIRPKMVLVYFQNEMLNLSSVENLFRKDTLIFTPKL
ncbi:hypothetical protein AVEN_24302-1 [Araneus ventricosus]|uniref:Uncharacterized protein n=1 Tax=Araneus ventricosus TaxID=182803 RepID=A0A4Y2Q456_ARAVE|nr:hypothetical protein AVEN_24302-1 [Araneus ventricosus]